MSLVENLKRHQDGFAIDIPHWEILDRGVTALTGPSGSGKTTVFRLLLGLEEAEPGFKWRMGADDLANLPVRERRLGIVFQSYELFPHMSARENIEFAARARKRDSAESAAHLADLAGLLGLSACLDRNAGVLSGGERQRVALARSLIGRPRLLLLDEPFSALDAHLRGEARALVRAAVEREDVPVVLVTHDREDLRAFAGLGKITELAEGRIVRESASISA